MLNKKKIKIKLLVLLSLTIFTLLWAVAWAEKRHNDYSSGMEIKYCTECHIENNITPNHGVMWIKEHRLVRERHPSNCTSCHKHSFCMECHKGGNIDNDLHMSNFGPDSMPATHRADFRELHPLKARQEPGSCARCHDNEKFCAACHNKFNKNTIANDSHRRQFKDIPLSSIGPRHGSFSPAECKGCHISGVLPHNEWSRLHAREARKNLSTCQTCHADGDVCMKCHSALSGLKVNPHPRNWSKISGRLKSSGNNKTCVKCH